MGCRKLKITDCFSFVEQPKSTVGILACDISYACNNNDLKVLESNSTKRATTYSYDPLGRLATVTDANGATTYSYTKVGSREGVELANGAKTTYQYDTLNRLTNLTNFDKDDAILSSYTYTLAPNGRRSAVAEQTLKDDNLTFSTRNIAYTYDALNRLTKEVSECADNAELAYTDEYTYDLVGNRLKKVHTADINETIDYNYNSNDQLISESSSTKGDIAYTYDANGSMTGKVGQDSSYIYTYNLQNRLSTATITSTEGTSLIDITSAYVYNQSGIRVGANTSTKIDGGTPEVKTTTYLTDPANFTGYSQV